MLRLLNIGGPEMKTVIVFLITVGITTLTFAQIAQGPASGSIPGGVMVNTGSFENIAVLSEGGPVPKRFFNDDEPAPIPMPPNMPPPTAPEGSNYFEDLSARGDLPPGPPPITIASFQGNNQSSGFPPDPILAVGPNHIMHLINSSFRISDKSGNTIRTISANSWFNTTISNPGAFDPKVFYDNHANRWVMVWDNQDPATQTAYFLVSVSDDDDPNGVWFNWALPANVHGSAVSGTWQDYESAGYDDQAYYITGRHFGFTSGYFGNAVRVLPKAQFLGGTPGPITWYDFWSLRDLVGNDVDGVRPSYVLSHPNEYYLAGPPNLTGGTYFALYRITNPLGVPAISCVHVPVTAWTGAPEAGQLGGGVGIEVGGSKVRHEVIYRDSSLWLAHPIAANGGYSAVRYVRINTRTNTAIEDVSFGASGFWYFYPSLAVDKDNNIGITFSRSGETEYAGAYYTWRLNTDPPGLRPTEQIHPGGGNYVVLGNGRNRWGDYMGSAVDPADASNLWFFTEYAPSTNSFATWVQGVRFAPYAGIRIYSSNRSVDLGNIEVGFSTDTATISISSIGTSTLTVSSIAITQPAYNLVNLPSLPANISTFDSVGFKVVFTPTAHGVVNDTITIASNDPANPTMKIPLRAKGFVIGHAQVGVMYSTSQTSGQLYSINVATGAPTAIGPFSLSNIEALAIRPSNKELIGTLSNSTGTVLYRMSTGFGDALQYTTIPVPSMRAIAFTPTGDTLYGATTSGRVYRINIATGDTTFLGANPGISFASLSFSPTSGKLWAGVRPPLTNKDRVYAINTSNGAATLAGSTGFTGQITPGLAFNALGVLFGITGNGTQINNFIRIDTLTAAGTLVGSTGLQNLNGLALRTDSLTTGVSEGSEGVLPGTYVLQQNYPNPFNPTTQIRYGLPQQSRVTLTIYNVVGQEVLRLVDGEQSAGFHGIFWDGTNATGASVASGIYFYKLEAHQIVGQSNATTSTFSDTKKMLLLK